MNNYEEASVEAEELSLAATRTRTRKDDELQARFRSSNEGEEKYNEDLEKGQPPPDESEHKQTIARNPNIVTWDGKDDPSNPKNWPRRRKWYATAVSFIVVSTMFNYR